MEKEPEFKKEIFNLIKTQKFDELFQFIKNKKIKNFDLKDDNYNHFIQYIVNYNQINILKFLLENKDHISLRIDIIDTDGRSILYNSIKFNYIDITKLLIEFNKTNIGISILDLKDKLGLTCLHYAVIFNNMEAFTLLLENGADVYLKAKDGANTFIIALMYKRNNMFINLLDTNPKKLGFYNNNGETILQVAINYNNNIIANKLLDNNKVSININNTSSDYGLTALHQCIILDNMDIFMKLLEKDNIDIVKADFYGNTAMHYIFIEKRTNYLPYLFNRYNVLNISSEYFNYTNINGETPLHILLSSDMNQSLINTIDSKIINTIIMETDLNIQNNFGQTCLFLMIQNNMITNFRDILVVKVLNVFIEDNMFNKIELTDELVDILIESYYNQLKLRKDDLLLDWEKFCSNDELDKLKKIVTHVNGENAEMLCKKKIRDVIVKEKRSLPLFQKMNLTFDNGIFTNFCFYTGSPIDILFGIILLYTDFKSKGLELVLDYPMVENPNLEEYYKKIGSNYPYKMDFSNIEIIWSYQKIFYPTYFEDVVTKLVSSNSSTQYIVIPIGIETASGAHANILFWDIKKKTIERFEPNGANYPMGLNYNPELLDNILESKFKQFDEKITYYPPYKFLPNIGFQILENLETDRCKKIGDPNGFCAVWCIWWVYQRMLNINNITNLKKFAEELIRHIKLDSISFKSVIRNFSKKITDIRDVHLKRVSIDINDWIVGNYTDDILSKIEKDIFKIISK